MRKYVYYVCKTSWDTWEVCYSDDVGEVLVDFYDTEEKAKVRAEELNNA